MLDVLGTELTDEDRKRLKHPLVGGVILFGRNYTSPAQLARLTAEIHAMRNPHLLAPVCGALALTAALLAPPAQAASPTATCEVDRPVRFSGLNWESNLVLAGIERYVLEHGYGCKTRPPVY